MIEQWAPFQNLLPTSITHNATSPLSDITRDNLSVDTQLPLESQRVFNFLVHTNMVELPFKYEVLGSGVVYCCSPKPRDASCCYSCV